MSAQETAAGRRLQRKLAQILDKFYSAVPGTPVLPIPPNPCSIDPALSEAYVCEWGTSRCSERHHIGLASRVGRDGHIVALRGHSSQTPTYVALYTKGRVVASGAHLAYRRGENVEVSWQREITASEAVVLLFGSSEAEREMDEVLRAT
jgi:hypothetical protein